MGNNYRHGHRGNGLIRPSRTYRCWQSMKRRINREDCHEHYTGVEIEEVWEDDFVAFLGDVGEAPSEEHTLDRIDNNKGYVKGNVRWLTMAEQSRNKTNNILFEGVILKDWCLYKGFNYKTVHKWYRQGFTQQQIKQKGEELWVKGQTMKS